MCITTKFYKSDFLPNNPGEKQKEGMKGRDKRQAKSINNNQTLQLIGGTQTVQCIYIDVCA